MFRHYNIYSGKIFSRYRDTKQIYKINSGRNIPLLIKFIAAKFFADVNHCITPILTDEITEKVNICCKKDTATKDLVVDWVSTAKGILMLKWDL